MARGIVVVGTPADVQEREFETKNGLGKSLVFKLLHPATQLGGTVECETRDSETWEKVVRAAESHSQIVAVAVPYGVPFVEKKDEATKGQQKAFVKLTVRAVLDA